MANKSRKLVGFEAHRWLIEPDGREFPDDLRFGRGSSPKEARDNLEEYPWDARDHFARERIDVLAIYDNDDLETYIENFDASHDQVSGSSPALIKIKTNTGHELIEAKLLGFFRGVLIAVDEHGHAFFSKDGVLYE